MLELVEKIRLIGKEYSNDDTLPMLVSEDGLPEVEGRESTRFELCDSVVQMGRFFPSLRSADLERERDGFLDRILHSGGYVPISIAPLSPDEKRAAADAMAAMLLGQLGAMETQNLIEGRKTLADLGLQDRLETLIRNSVGRPLHHTIIASHSSPSASRNVQP